MKFFVLSRFCAASSSSSAKEKIKIKGKIGHHEELMQTVWGEKRMRSRKKDKIALKLAGSFRRSMAKMRKDLFQNPKAHLFSFMLFLRSLLILFISRKFTLFISHFVSLSGIPFLCCAFATMLNDNFFGCYGFHVSLFQYAGDFSVCFCCWARGKRQEAKRKIETKNLGVEIKLIYNWLKIDEMFAWNFVINLLI